MCISLKCSRNYRTCTLVFLFREVSAIYASHASFELKQKECSDRTPSPLELGLRLVGRSTITHAIHTQIDTVKHIVAILSISWHQNWYLNCFFSKNSCVPTRCHDMVHKFDSLPGHPANSFNACLLSTGF